MAAAKVSFILMLLLLSNDYYLVSTTALNNVCIVGVLADSVRARLSCGTDFGSRSP